MAAGPCAFGRAFDDNATNLGSHSGARLFVLPFGPYARARSPARIDAGLQSDMTGDIEIDRNAVVLRPRSGRLFEGVDAGRVALEPVRAEPTQRVTHLTYAVRER